MKKTVLSLAALALSAGAASAQITAVAAPLGSGSGYADRTTVIYSAMDGPYQAFAAATGNLGFDDYDSTLAGGVSDLTSLRFVGGVTAVGGIIDFNFFATDGVTLIDSFAVAFPQAGNFIWTITLNSPVVIPDAGFLQLNARAGTTGQWFLSTTAPTIGTESRALGDTTTHSHRFELSVPAPGAAAVLGMGGLLAARRRRR